MLKIPLLVIGFYNKIGVLLGGDINLYGNLTAYEIIQYFGILHGANHAAIIERIEMLDTRKGIELYQTEFGKDRF